MDEGAALGSWVRRYLENGIANLESLPAYRGSYLFISSVRAAKKPVIDQWAINYAPDRDFPRLVAERIRKRLERDLSSKPPDIVYGPYYEKAIKSAYQYAFWGSLRLDDTWVLGREAVQEEGEAPKETLFWGFILLSIPRETLEIQVSELLSKIVPGTTPRTATKEQAAAFEYVKEHFFEQF